MSSRYVEIEKNRQGARIRFQTKKVREILIARALLMNRVQMNLSERIGCASVELMVKDVNDPKKIDDWQRKRYKGDGYGR